MNGYAQESFDRPAKRIKSERLHAAEWSLRDERPRSSHTYQTQVTREDAELLLSLRDAFRAPTSFNVPIPQPSFTSQDCVDYKTETSIELFSFDPAPEDHSHELYASAQPTTQDSPPEPSGAFEALASSHAVSTSELSKEDQQQESILPETDLDTRMDSPTEEQQEDDYPKPPPIQSATGTAEQEAEDVPQAPPPKKQRKIQPETQAEFCTACQRLAYNESEEESTMLWIGCEGCKRWFHYPCAGFSDRQEAKSVDKFICNECEPNHGKTTFVRKSSRPRTAIDYAGLNEGVVKSSEETTMHHYVPRFKDGSIQWHADDFARLRPELLTQDFWENMDGMKRPFVVPACWNPRWGQNTTEQVEERDTLDAVLPGGDNMPMFTGNGEKVDSTATTTLRGRLTDEEVVDVDQDYLDMVMPRNLTVRQVAELYGPDEPVPVIDVKSQETKGKFTLRQWANYYEDPANKPVRNVISLEVSHSRLGRIIRRPKVVRDIDLEDQVWDVESRNACNKRPVAFYCLMSVADSYTDFHIDFGGSSVYYHILKGTKTFFFIPPEDRYLKKYEEWCLSDAQNETWLGDLCNGNVTRVDLHEGDTAFIPAGWMHSVWTPEDSLVIGGNFLTRYDFDYQLKVAQIEKVTKVAQSFRYPFFQKVMWYTLLKYLDDDPVPESIIREFQDDPEYRYLRANPIWLESETYTIDNEPEEGDYNARNYSKSELRGLPMLRDYLYRTARISADLPVENITKKQVDAVKGSIPKGHGDPMQLICLFAVWCAWKMGNVTVPDWIHEDSVLQQGVEKQAKDKTKKAEALRIPPERQSARRKLQASSATPEPAATPEIDDVTASRISAKMITPRIACEACRKKRIKCRHKDDSRLDETAQQTLEKNRIYPNVNVDVAKLARASPIVSSTENPASQANSAPASSLPIVPEAPPETATNTDLAQAALARMTSQPPETNGVTMNGATPGSAKKGRSKACEECRKSKVSSLNSRYLEPRNTNTSQRRCVHDEYGRIDPAKVAEPSKPRGSSSSKRPRLSDENTSSKRQRAEVDGDNEYAVVMSSMDVDLAIDPALMGPAEHMEGVAYHDPMAMISDSGVMSTPPHLLATRDSVVDNGVFDMGVIDPNLDPALQAPIEGSTAGEPDAQMAETDVLQQEAPALAELPKLKTLATNTPDLDKSFSPLTASADEQPTEAPQSVAEPVQPAQSTTNIDPEPRNTVQEPQINGVVHIKPEPLVDGGIPTNPRRHSSTATGVSPKQEELMSPGSLSRRSSSNTSGTTHQAAAGSNEPISVDTQDDVDVPKSESTSAAIETVIKEETMSPSHARHFERASTAASSVSDADADERLARELQAAEHGLRRRASVRAS